MTAQQRIVRVRRNYNQWVANQTLEDYALRFTAKSARKWSSARVANTAIGAVSFLALEAIGGSIAINYGFVNATAAILIVGALIFLTSIPIAYYASSYGVDIDLLTRGAGFGYIGSTITSLIYASFTFLFFAIEAAIMSLALEMCFGVPLFIGYIISSLVVIPLVTHGITLISRFQAWTQPFWLFLHLLPFAFIAIYAPRSFGEWTQFRGTAETDWGDIQHPLVRHRLDGRLLAHCADRRAGRLPAFPAGARRQAKLELVGRLSIGRTGLDRTRRAQNARRFVSGVPRDSKPGSCGQGGGTDPDVSRRVPVCLFLA